MPNTSDKMWYVLKGIKRLGPFSNAEMRGLASSGKLVPEDMIWKDGLDGWVKASKLKGVFQVQPEIQEVSPPPIESEPETSNQQSGNPSGSILLVTTIICSVVVIVIGGGLIISAGQKKSTKSDISTRITSSEKIEIPTGNSATPIVGSKEPEKFKETNIIEVKVLKISQYLYFAKMDIEVANKSDKYIQFLGLNISIYDKSGKYISFYGKPIINLRPDKSVIIDPTFSNVDYKEIGSWKITLDGVHIDLQNGRIDRQGEKVFVLKEVDN